MSIVILFPYNNCSFIRSIGSIIYMEFIAGVFVLFSTQLLVNVLVIYNIIILKWCNHSMHGYR